ncbi:MAG TPA: hypothetical protein ENM97_03490 [Moorella mulderi]|nr:hypothetical protein [Moorella mulderi]
MRIYIAGIHINSLRNNAGYFSGENLAKGWRSRSKANAAFGRLNGDRNLVASQLNCVWDGDFLDTFIKLRSSVKKP